MFAKTKDVAFLHGSALIVPGSSIITSLQFVHYLWVSRCSRTHATKAEILGGL